MLPRGWYRRTIVLLTFALLLVIALNFAHAQVFDLERERVQMAEFHGAWRFQPGDDPEGKLGWANPDFNDSSWKLLHADQPANAQGYPDLTGMAWYRFRIVVPAAPLPLALYIPEMGTSYQVFAGGRLIGQFGGLPPHEKVYLYQYGDAIGHPTPLGQVIPIPSGASNGTGSIVVALRVWITADRGTYGMPGFQAPTIGDARLLNEKRQHTWNFLFWSLSAENCLLLGYLLAALAGFGLFLLRSAEREYLWFAAVELAYAGEHVWSIYPAYHPVWSPGFDALNGLLLFLQTFCLLIFFITLLKQRWGWVARISMGSVILGTLMFIPVDMGLMSFLVALPLTFLAWLPFMVGQVLMLALAARRGNLDARLLLAPFILQYGAILSWGLLLGIQSSGHNGPVITFLTEKWGQFCIWPFPISVQNIADFLCQISILAVLVLRFARTRRDEERFKAELEAARTVQQVLIPEEIPVIPGLALDCVYKPAGQVSGDFFQILPTRDNGALIVIGDVSGKGMPAAMAVSLLVGTVRTLAHYTQSPGEILSAMNQRMLARSKEGFTTCMVLRIDPGGAVTLANAGHIPPYLGAQELPVESDLPLGLSAAAVYTESSFSLEMGQDLTLVTDGIAEARAKNGELFGFERTASISILSAEHIACTAQAFGQQDDITVLKIRRCPVSESAGIALTAAASPSVA